MTLSRGIGKMKSKKQNFEKWSDDGVIYLVAEMVRSACFDHIAIEKEIAKTEQQKNVKNKKMELEILRGYLYMNDKFFDSPIYALACGIDKDTILARFRKMTKYHKDVSRKRGKRNENHHDN